MPTGKLNQTIIEAAIDGFEAQKQRIDAQIAELRAMLTGTSEPKRRKFSAAAIKRMKEAQRLRWAKIRGESPDSKTAKPKGGITEAGRQALSLAMKKRWAAKRAASGQSARAAKKGTKAA